MLRLDYARIFITTKLVGGINEVEDFLVGGKKYPTRFVEDLEFGLGDDTCLVEYEEKNESQGTESDCEFGDAPLVDNLVNQLHVEFTFYRFFIFFFYY